MTNVTIFGDGNMGSAIAGLLTAGGATVDHITTADNGAGTVSGDIVILAVPYPALDRSFARTATNWRAGSSLTSPTR